MFLLSSGRATPVTITIVGVFQIVHEPAQMLQCKMFSIDQKGSEYFFINEIVVFYYD